MLHKKKYKDNVFIVRDNKGQIIKTFHNVTDENIVDSYISNYKTDSITKFDAAGIIQKQITAGAVFNRYDKAEIKTDAFVTTPQGYLKIDAFVTRTGIFTYHDAAGNEIKELRLPADILNEQSLNSMVNLPYTAPHPPVMLDATNTAEYQKGFTTDFVDIDDSEDEYKIKLTVIVTDAQAIRDIKEGKITELSLGYTANLINKPGEYKGQKYDAIQVNHLHNHLSGVQMGRAGNAKFIYDNTNTESGGKKMGQIHLDGKNYEVSEVVELAVKHEFGRLDEQISSYKKEKEALTGKVDALNAELEKAKKIDVMALAMNRASLINKVSHVLKDMKLDTMSDSEIKKAAIKTVNKDINIENASDDRIDGIFEVLIKAENKADSYTQLVDGMGGQQPPAAAKSFYDEAAEAMAKFYNDRAEAHNKPIPGAYIG